MPLPTVVIAKVLLLTALIRAATIAPARAQAPPPAQPPAWREVPVAPGAFRDQEGTYRSESVDVPVTAGGGSIEYMVRMRADAAMVYSWRVVEIADPAKLTSEFDGHTDRAPGTTGSLVFYRKATGGRENGTLVAPFEGIHGWYFKNDTDLPVVVRVTLAGFYEVIPGQIPE